MVDPKELVLDLARTFTHLSDGSVDDGDLVILDSLKELVEAEAEGKLEEILEDEKIRVAFGAAGTIIPILVSMLWPD
jgi:hypothetical protein